MKLLLSYFPVADTNHLESGKTGALKLNLGNLRTTSHEITSSGLSLPPLLLLRHCHILIAIVAHLLDFPFSLCPCSKVLKLLQIILRVFISMFNYGTRKAEVLKSLIMKITANENDTNDILQTFQ